MTITIYRRALVVISMGALVGFPLFSGLSLAGAPPSTTGAPAGAHKHISESIEHANAAVALGKQGYADAVAQHAEEALKHAHAAGMKNPHLDEGIKSLEQSVEHGKAGHADVATKHAESAVTHLSQVK